MSQNKSNQDLLPINDSFTTFEEAWEKVNSLYIHSLEKLGERFKEFDQIVKEVLKEGLKSQEMTVLQEEEIIKRCHWQFSDTVDYCYPLILLRPKHNLYGDKDTYEHKILARGNEYWATITQPANAVIEKYYRDELTALSVSYQEAHNAPLDIYVTTSKLPIPISFTDKVDGKVYESIKHPAIRKLIRRYFDLPNLRLIGDAILDRNFRKNKVAYDYLMEKIFGKNLASSNRITINDPLSFENNLHPLCHFDALRTDASISRLKHYTHTDSNYFQPYILLTNYERYVYKFLDDYFDNKKSEGSLVLPYPPGEVQDNYIITVDNFLQTFKTDGKYQIDIFIRGERIRFRNEDGSYNFDKIDRGAQMPAYHFRPNDLSEEAGVTLINIGVGPSNAKTITDHLAVLRPYCWLMLGHCGGLRYRQQLGEFISAKSYIRDDRILDNVLPQRLVPLSTPVIVQEAFEVATYNIVEKRHKKELEDKNEKMDEETIKHISWQRFSNQMRTGNVYTTSDRNWEFQPIENLIENLEISRVLAIDMESATIAGNGYRYRVPFGALLCISDLPMHGESKMRNAADSFYENSTKSHLEIGLEAIKFLSSTKTNEKHKYMSPKERLRTVRELRGGVDPIFS